VDCTLHDPGPNSAPEFKLLLVFTICARNFGRRVPDSRVMAPVYSNPPSLAVKRILSFHVEHFSSRPDSTARGSSTRDVLRIPNKSLHFLDSEGMNRTEGFQVYRYAAKTVTSG
jgi:hypothetical protein